jgi:secondary thiamine-phosphate synthase enzyme
MHSAFGNDLCVRGGFASHRRAIFSEFKASGTTRHTEKFCGFEYLSHTMMQTIPVQTGARQQLVLITAEVQQAVAASGVQEGLCVLFCPHTTAALTINSYLDAATALDMQDEIDRLVPTRTNFKHIFDTPGDAAGHIKSSLTGIQLTLIVHEGRALLGDSQGIFFWEFDGPRKRKVHVKVVAG